MTTNLGRRAFLGAAGSAFSFGQASQRPNILLISTDQQSNGVMSADGNPFLKTPAMDSIAANGVSFSESYCTYPVCSPSRSSWFTSRMPHETGVRVNSLPIKAGMPTMGELFRESGYQTVYAGKWHLPDNSTRIPGFEVLAAKKGNGGSGDPGVADACSNFLVSKPSKPFLMVASFVNPHDVCDWIRDHEGSRTYPNLSGYPPAPKNMASDPDEPEYLQYHRTANKGRMSNAVWIASKWNRDDFRFYLHSYYRLVEKVDSQIGRVLEALNSSGLSSNTLVVLTADHGEGMGAHRWTQKAAFWEETVKVPLIFAGAGINRQGVRDEKSLVSGLDILPTICDYAGVSAPSLIRGASLRGALSGTPLERPFVVSEISDFVEEGRQGRMLRTSRYKYVVFNGGQRPEQLFDLLYDPGETENLARRQDAAEALGRHRQILRDWIAKTQDDFRPPGSA